MLDNNATLQELINTFSQINAKIVDRGGSQTITPSTTNKVLAKGNYKGDITVLGDADLKPQNIRKGINVFGVDGSMEESKITNLYNYKNTSSPLYGMNKWKKYGSDLATSETGSLGMYFYISDYYPVNGYIESLATFDVTEYNLLRIYMHDFYSSSYGGFKFGIFKGSSYETIEFSGHTVTNGTSKALYLDVTNITGLIQLHIYAYTQSNSNTTHFYIQDMSLIKY